MNQLSELRYIQAFCKIIGVKQERAVEYAQKRGIDSLVNNASQLLTTKTQQEKHKAFIDLYRMSGELTNENPILNSPLSVSRFMQGVMTNIHDRETFVVAFLNVKNRVIGYEEVSTGTINQAIVYPREVFRNAIVSKAASVIICHNHPSGDLTPSNQDHLVTKKVKELGEALKIPVLDHVVISGIDKDAYYSFKENGFFERTTLHISIDRDGNVLPGEAVDR